MGSIDASKGDAEQYPHGQALSSGDVQASETGRRCANYVLVGRSGIEPRTRGLKGNKGGICARPGSVIMRSLSVFPAEFGPSRTGFNQVVRCLGLANCLASLLGTRRSDV